MCVVLSFMRFPLGRATVRPMSTAACRIRKRSPEKDHDKPDPRSAGAKDLRKQVCPSKLGRHIELFLGAEMQRAGLAVSWSGFCDSSSLECRAYRARYIAPRTISTRFFRSFRD